jgi:hypothetical protein
MMPQYKVNGFSPKELLAIIPRLDDSTCARCGTPLAWGPVDEENISVAWCCGIHYSLNARRGLLTFEKDEE